MTHVNQELRLDICDSLTIWLKTVALQIGRNSLEYFNFVINLFLTHSAHHCMLEARMVQVKREIRRYEHWEE